MFEQILLAISWLLHQYNPSHETQIHFARSHGLYIPTIDMLIIICLWIYQMYTYYIHNRKISQFQFQEARRKMFCDSPTMHVVLPVCVKKAQIKNDKSMARMMSVLLFTDSWRRLPQTVAAWWFARRAETIFYMNTINSSSGEVILRQLSSAFENVFRRLFRVLLFFWIWQIIVFLKRIFDVHGSKFIIRNIENIIKVSQM